jgi:hypothetical protein
MCSQDSLAEAEVGCWTHLQRHCSASCCMLLNAHGEGKRPPCTIHGTTRHLKLPQAALPAAPAASFQGVGNVAQAAKEVGGVQRVVLVSSGLVTPARRFHPIRLMLNTIVARGQMDAKYKGERCGCEERVGQVWDGGSGQARVRDRWERRCRNRGELAGKSSLRGEVCRGGVNIVCCGKGWEHFARGRGVLRWNGRVKQDRRTGSTPICP